MSLARGLDPFPMWMNGYFCLDEGEGKLARKSVDPGRPKVEGEQRDIAARAATKATETSASQATGLRETARPPLQANRVNAVQNVADTKLEKASTYTPSGGTSTPPSPSGQNYSVKA